MIKFTGKCKTLKNQNNFNTIAPLYDGLSNLVFGSKIRKAQVNSLSFILPGSKVLITGGGTGWILDELAKIFPSGLDITYLDKSPKMIELSKKRNMASNKITFMCSDVEDTNLNQQEYDVILTPFFLDCFSQATAETVCIKLDTCLKNGGMWIYDDFHLSPQSKSGQKILVKTMYVFFKLFSKIQADRLPDLDVFFSKYALVSQKTYYTNFIRSQVFRKR